IQHQNGVINTQSDNSARVVKNENMVISLDVPVTTPDRLSAAANNITHAWNKVFTKPAPVVTAQPVIVKPVTEQEMQEAEDLMHDKMQQEQSQEEKLPESMAMPDQDPELKLNPQAIEMSPLDLQSIPTMSDAEVQALSVIDPKTLSPQMIVTLKFVKQGVGEGAEVFMKVVTKDGKEGLLPAVFAVRKIQFLYAFGLNLALQQGDFKAATLDTAADFIVSKGIQKLALALGCDAAAGPIGWTMFVCDIMNELVVKNYDIPKIAEQSVDHRVAAKESIKNGNFFEYQYNREMANAYQQQWQTYYATNRIAAFSNWLNNFVTGRSNTNDATTPQQQPSAKNTLK
ncbi:MAG TPA: hypothetical protein VI522_07780, partial [Gammaproteobacteria bacterium]|nr:hypothetical protein [Gammaproteobacteria bacterium]